MKNKFHTNKIQGDNVGGDNDSIKFFIIYNNNDNIVKNNSNVNSNSNNNVKLSL
jgi:hypothetical protein